MSQGQGSVTVNQKAPVNVPAGPPFTANSADNGLSVDPVSHHIVLGQTVGAVGNPAKFLSAREIPMDGNLFEFTDLGGRQLYIEPTTGDYRFGDIDGNANGLNLLVEDAIRTFLVSDSLGNYLSIDAFNQLWNGFPGGAGDVGFQMDGVNKQVTAGDINSVTNGLLLSIDIGNNVAQIANQANVNPGLFVDFLNKDYVLGDFFSNNNGVFWEAFDGGNVASGCVKIGTAGRRGIELLGSPLLQFAIGDVGNNNNNTEMRVDDTVGEIQIKNAAATAKVRINGTLGFTGVVAPVNTITVIGGIVTNVA